MVTIFYVILRLLTIQITPTLEEIHNRTVMSPNHVITKTMVHYYATCCPQYHCL